MRPRAAIQADLDTPKPETYKMIPEAVWKERVQRNITLELLLDIRDLLIELKGGSEGSR